MTALPDLVPDIFLVPYTLHDPDLCFVVEDGGRAVGYIVGCADTVRFATWCQESRTIRPTCTSTSHRSTTGWGWAGN
jgi:hypothetical protein